MTAIISMVVTDIQKGTATLEAVDGDIKLSSLLNPQNPNLTNFEMGEWSKAQQAQFFQSVRNVLLSRKPGINSAEDGACAVDVSKLSQK